MDQENKKKNITRKDFLRISGSLVAGGAIAGISGKLIYNMVRNPEKVFYEAEGDAYQIPDGDDSVSPYKKVLSIKTDNTIEAFDLEENRMVAAGEGTLTVYSSEGNVESSFTVGPDVRDICVDRDAIYLLFPARIAVYNPSGTLLREWAACSDNSDYCSLTVSPAGVYVTDVFAKNICHYTHDGSLVRFIESPDGFVVPSYCFGIASHDGIIYCSNPGRHRVERYTEDGRYLSCFGQAGTAKGSFSGCCNPVHLSVSEAGEILTCEKGIPRISCFAPDGTFRSVILNRKALGGGYDAYEARIAPDGRIAVSGKNAITLYKYDPQLAQGNACAACGVANCPIRRGITV